MECYLDNAATTRVLPEVADLMIKVMEEDYGNPSSLHGKGFVAEKYIRQARGQIASALKCDEGGIIFTSGGTESNNSALIGAAYANIRRGKHIVTTSFEHPSVSESLIYLEQQGFEITFLPVTKEGLVTDDALRNALKDDTILVSIMWVNNETGAMQDMAALSRVVKEYNSDIIFHTDAVQAFGKLKINIKKSGVDLLSISGHKLHGPKGVGILYAADGVKLHPYIHGGGQQKNRRSGTENVPGIAGLGLAAERAYTDIDDNYKYVKGLSARLIGGLKSIDGVVIHGRDYASVTKSSSREVSGVAEVGYHAGQSQGSVSNICEDGFSPYIISAGIEGVRAEVLLHALEDKGIYVSSGSACSSNHPGVSGSLTAMGVDKAYLDSTIRFSLSRFTTDDEIDLTVDTLDDLIPALRRFTRK